MSQLQSTREVIAALGGIAKVAEITGRSYKLVSGWQGTRRAVFPAFTFFALQQALAKAGLSAHPALWHKMDAAPVKQDEASV